VAPPDYDFEFVTKLFKLGGNMADFDQELDARGLNCPLPILRAKKALNDLSGGQVLRIVATDPGSVKDFQAFAKQTGNELLESGEGGGEFTFLIKKKG
jgi:tRNA 2-thiouridine synthesizing protein A